MSRPVLQCWLGAGSRTIGGWWLVRANDRVASPPSAAVPTRHMAGHTPIRNAWLLCPRRACFLPSSPRAQPCLGLQHFTRSAFFHPWAVGAVHTWELPFPHFLDPFVGAFRPFATSIPPLSDRGWGQRKPDSSYLPAPVFPPRDGWTDSLLTGVGGVSLCP